MTYSSEFLWSSNVQSSTPSNMRFLPKSILNKIHPRHDACTRGGRSMGESAWLGGSFFPRFRVRVPTRSAVAAVSPISALPPPPELLVQIFFRSLAFMVPPLHGRVAVTHVCQRWPSSCARRLVAVGHDHGDLRLARNGFPRCWSAHGTPPWTSDLAGPA